MSVTNRKPEKKLFDETFLKWSVPQILTTLQKAAIETALAITNFASNAKQTDFEKMAENISDFEVMVKVATYKFPLLREDINRIKRDKLIALKEQTIKNKTAKTESKEEIAEEVLIEKKWTDKFKFWN